MAVAAPGQPPRQYGVDDAILSRRPSRYDLDARWSLEVSRGASAGPVAVVGPELCPERRQSNGSAVKLEGEPVFVSPRRKVPYPSGLKRPQGHAAALRHSTRAPSRSLDVETHAVRAGKAGDVVQEAPSVLVLR